MRVDLGADWSTRLKSAEHQLAVFPHARNERHARSIGEVDVIGSGQLH